MTEYEIQAIDIESGDKVLMRSAGITEEYTVVAVESKGRGVVVEFDKETPGGKRVTLTGSEFIGVMRDE